VITTDTAAAKIGRSMKKCEKRMACVPQRAPLTPLVAFGRRSDPAEAWRRRSDPRSDRRRDTRAFSPRECPSGTP
jgi:hypothetical protein